MRRATVDDLARAPVGRFVAGETFVHFCAAPDLWGVILWGRPNEQHAIELGRSLVLELAPPAEPHASIVDASRIEGGDPGAFQAADRYMTRYRPLLEHWVTRLALVRPRGMSGAIVAGAYEVMPRPYPVAIFEDVSAALGWLMPKPDDLWPAMIATLYADAAGTPQIVGALRAFLDGHLAGTEIADAARALGLSERTLQRKLGAAGTTFKDELADARIRAAKQKLTDSDEPLTAIAFDVGCASLQHFSAMFRKRTRQSPSAFRAHTKQVTPGNG